MDIGQMGAGDDLFKCIVTGMNNANVVILCLNKKYPFSVNCGKEVKLMNFFKKPVIIVEVEKGAFPPLGWLQSVLENKRYFDITTNYSVESFKIAQETYHESQDKIFHLDNSIFPENITLPSHLDEILNFKEKVVTINRLPILLPTQSSVYDLARSRPAAASSCFLGGGDYEKFHPSHVTDGLSDTRWSGAFDSAGECWIEISLGCVGDIEKIKINFETAYAKKFSIKVFNSREDKKWNSVGIFQGKEGWFDYNLKATGDRFRLYLIEAREPDWGMSIYTIRLLGTTQELQSSEIYFSHSEDDNYLLINKIIRDISVTLSKRCKKSKSYALCENDKIRERISKVDFVIAALSKGYANLISCQRDIEIAMELGKPIIPLLIEVGTPFPPPNEIMKIAFDKALYVDLSNLNTYIQNFGLLIKKVNNMYGLE